MKINLKESKGATNIIVVMLLICILILICLLFYFILNPIVKVDETKEAEIPKPSNTATVETQKAYTYKDIKGTYKYNEEKDGIICAYTLSLSDDGTFNYVTTIDNHAGFCGNYVINDSEIILNKLFGYGSDVGLQHIDGKVILEITDNKTIYDTNQYEDSPLKNIYLKKESTELSDTLDEYIKTAIKSNSMYEEIEE